MLKIGSTTRTTCLVVFLLLVEPILRLPFATGFVVGTTRHNQFQSVYSFELNQAGSSSSSSSSASSTGGSSTGATALPPVSVLKQELLELLPRMTGKTEELRQVEYLVNSLEAAYQPVQTLAFLNLAMMGDWQLLFSTNYAGSKQLSVLPNPNQFRLRELYQSIDCQGLKGTIINRATWDLAEQDEEKDDDDYSAELSTFAPSTSSFSWACTGRFSVKCQYQINQGARMIIVDDTVDHVLEPARGSKIPTNVPALVGLLHRAMPRELFDPSKHALDTTFLDADVRIVRYTGSNSETGSSLEGVRDIFIRKGQLTIDPTASSKKEGEKDTKE